MADKLTKEAQELRDLALENVGIVKDLGKEFAQLDRIAGTVANQVKKTTVAGQAALKIEHGLYKVKRLFGMEQDDIIEQLLKGNKENKKSLRSLVYLP